MKLKNLILLFLLSICFVSMGAQNNRGNGQKFDLKSFQEKRAAFFIKELNLTPDETKAFIPLVNELMQKKYQLNRAVRDDHRALNGKANKTAADYQKSIEMALDARIKEAELQKEYMKKFMTVLSAEKVYKYHHVEMKFMEQEVQRHKKQRIIVKDKKQNN